jgi:hypothetical protein
VKEICLGMNREGSEEDEGGNDDEDGEKDGNGMENRRVEEEKYGG